ncbi:MAG TPA: hypothetical protein VFF69_13785 [Phycisphaerales bacterium]|nr:hypothetical protein [Phycisphaerales bacterium]
MKLRGEVAILSQDGQQLSAVWGAIRNEHVRVRGWLAAERPAGVEADAASTGKWIGEALREAGCTTRACVIAVPRASVVLKRLTFPALRDAGEGDLAGMVQIQMARQLSMPLQGAAIDYVRLGSEGGESAPSASTDVLAAALPGENVTWCRDVARDARLKLRSVALRVEGSAALFAQLSYTQGGPVLGVSITPMGVELGIVSEGRVAFSRAVDIPQPSGVEEWSSFGEKVALEAKRTRIGYRGLGETRDLACVAVLGDDSLAGSVAKALGAELELPWQTVRFPNAVELPSEMDGSTRAGLAPLIGLMLGAAINRPTYDFANPRKAPDTAAPIRQASLAAVLGLIIFGGGGFVLGSQRYSALESKVKAAETSAFDYQERYVRQLRAEARLQHVQKLREPAVDWVEHLAYLSESMPPAELARLTSIDGTLKSAVAFGKQTESGEVVEAKSLREGEWIGTRRIEFNLAGLASRDVANSLRGRLVASSVYGAQTRGADVFNEFEYQLTTSVPSPDEVMLKDAPRGGGS